MQSDGVKDGLNKVTSCVSEHNNHPSIKSARKRVGQLKQFKHKKTQ